MTKKPRGLIWDVNATWEANIHAVLDAAAVRRVPSAAVRAKQSKARLAWWAKKRKARQLQMEALVTARGLRSRMPVGQRPADLILLTLAGGAWLSMPDIRERTGLPTNNINPALQRLHRLGWLEKAHNADRPQGVLSAVPKFLWRLTAAGEAERAVLELC